MGKRKLLLIPAIIALGAIWLTAFLGFNASHNDAAETPITTNAPKYLPDTYKEDGYVDRSTLVNGDQIVADKGSIQVVNDEHTIIHEVVYDWKVTIKEEGKADQKLDIAWDEGFIVPYGKIYTYSQPGTFTVTDIPGTRFESGTCIAILNNGVLTIGSKTGYDATMDDHDKGNRAEWSIQPFNGYITKVVVDEKVNWVGNGAFYDLYNLKTVEFSSSVNTLGNDVFEGCSSLETIEIPETITSIGSGLFKGCSSLKNITIPDTLPLTSYMFSGCSSLTSIDFIAGRNSIPAGCFSGCSGLVDIKIPDSITYVYSQAFSGCSNLKKITLSDNMQEIGNTSFANIANLEEVVMGAKINHVDHNAFMNCNKLAKLWFKRPSNPDTAPEIVFEGKLGGQGGGQAVPKSARIYYLGEDEDIVLLYKGGKLVLREEGDLPYYSETVYDQDVYPSTIVWRNIHEVAKWTSGDCEVIRDYYGPVSVKLRHDGGEGNDGSGRMADNLDGNAIRQVTPYDTAELYIEDGVTYLGANAFNTFNMTSVNIPSSVTSIGNSAFESCTYLKQLTLPANLDSVGAYAFQCCASIETVEMPGGRSIGDFAFDFCSSLTTINLPDTLVSIGGQAFGNCSSLKTITIPKSVRSIGWHVFTYSDLEKIVFERFDEDATINVDFSYDSISHVYLSEIGTSRLFSVNHLDGTISEVKDDAWLGGVDKLYWRTDKQYESGDCIVNTSGFEVEVSKKTDGNGTGKMADYDSVEDTPWYSYVGEFRYFTINEGVTSIGDRAFSGCQATEIELPQGLKTIGEEAFSGAELDSLTIPNSVTKIGSNAFSDGGTVYFVRIDESNEGATIELGEGAISEFDFAYANSGEMFLCDGNKNMIGLSPYEGTFTWRKFQYEFINYTNSSYGFEITVDDNNVSCSDAGQTVYVRVLDGEEEFDPNTTTLVAEYISLESPLDITKLIGASELSDGGRGTVCKVVDGKVVLVKGDEVLFELTDDYEVRHYGAIDNSFGAVTYLYYTEFYSDGKPTLRIQMHHQSRFNQIDWIGIYDSADQSNYLFQSDVDWYRYEDMPTRKVKVTKIEDGLYSFTMPAADIYLNVGVDSGQMYDNIIDTSTGCSLDFTVNGEEPTVIKTGDTVTVKINVNENNEFSKISAYLPKNLYKVSELASILGDAVFMSFEDPNITCKVNGQGKIAIYNGDELQYELTSNDLSLVKETFQDPMVGTMLDMYYLSSVIDYDNFIEYSWRFNLDSNGYITSIAVFENDYPVFQGDGSSSTGGLCLDIAFNTVVEGKEYTFVMPEGDVVIRAVATQLYLINSETENGVVTTSANNKTTSIAKQGDVVTITVQADKGYELEDIVVCVPTDTIESIEQLTTFIGENVFQGMVDEYLDMDYSDKCIKVNESGSIVVMKDDEIILELPSDSYIDYQPNPDCPELTQIIVGTIDGIWYFNFEGNTLLGVEIYDLYHNYLFVSEAGYTGEIPNKMISLTTVTEGKEYTFIMPRDDVNIVATFAVVSVHDHNETTLEHIEAKPATCTEAGNSAYYRCSICGNYYADVNGQNEITAESTVIAALGHTESNWITTKEATCTEKGSKHKECTVCHTELEAEDIPALGHDLIHHEAKAATCTEKGYEAYDTCSRCNYTTYQEIAALGHDWGEWKVTKEATEFEEGIEERECSRCHEKQNRSIPMLGHEHNIVPVEAKDPTCEEAGNIAHYICTGCKQLYADVLGEKELNIEDVEIIALGHEYKFDSFVWEENTAKAKYICERDHEHIILYDAVVTSEVTTAPTCLKAGEKVYTATYEGHSDIKTETLEALGHDIVHHDAQAATCTEKGWNAYDTCSRCDYSTYQEIAALGHDYEIVVTAPTCTERGYTTHTCSLCEHSYVDTYVDALGHSWGEWVVTKAAEAGVKGEETRTCSACGAKENRDIPALPYVPTTTPEGEKIYNEVVTEEAKDMTEIFKQAKEEVGSVEIKATTDKNEEFTIKFDSNAVNAIGDANVTISAKVTTENVKVENAELVLEVTVAGATFEKGNATVEIPFVKEIPSGKVGKVYYIDDQGKKTDMHARFENGKVVFTTNHFSTYAVMFENVPGLSGGAIAGIVIGGLFLLIILFLLVMFLVFPRYIIDYQNKKVIRTIYIKKHDDMVLLFDTHLRKVRRNEADVYKNIEDAQRVLSK